MCTILRMHFPLTQKVVPPSLEFRLVRNTVVKVKVLVPQSCPTLASPWTVACHAPVSIGILQARILEWLAMPFSRGSFQPRVRTLVSCFASRFFTIRATREAQEHSCCTSANHTKISNNNNFRVGSLNNTLVGNRKRSG